MAGTITALESQKRSKDRVNVYLDGAFAFGLDLLVAVNLKVGTFLSDDEIAELRAADGLERAHSRALDYLSYRPRSEREMRRYLSRKDYPESIVEEVVARLLRAGLVNDVEFARYWVDNRSRFRPRGERMLRYELRQKGVSSRAMDQALGDYDEVAAIEKEAKAQARRLQHLSGDEFRRRLTGRLARRGFSYYLIRETLDTLDFPQLKDS